MKCVANSLASKKCQKKTRKFWIFLSKLRNFFNQVCRKGKLIALFRIFTYFPSFDQRLKFPALILPLFVSLMAVEAPKNPKQVAALLTMLLLSSNKETLQPVPVKVEKGAKKRKTDNLGNEIREKYPKTYYLCNRIDFLKERKAETIPLPKRHFQVLAEQMLISIFNISLILYSSPTPSCISTSMLLNINKVNKHTPQLV